MLLSSTLALLPTSSWPQTIPHLAPTHCHSLSARSPAMIMLLYGQPATSDTPGSLASHITLAPIQLDQYLQSHHRTALLHIQDHTSFKIHLQTLSPCVQGAPTCITFHWDSCDHNLPIPPDTIPVDLDTQPCFLSIPQLVLAILLATSQAPSP
jgi:hypothetical protein